MFKHGRFHCLIVVSSWLLTGCLNSVWTGANMIYNRHHLYKKINDYQLAVEAQHLLFRDKALKPPDSILDLAVFNGDVLLVGQVTKQELRTLANDRINNLHGYRKLYSYIMIKPSLINSLDDTWITTKIRSQMIADSNVDPASFKIVTAAGIVYVMGDVEASQAAKVLKIASETGGVIRVVKLLNCYQLAKFSLSKS